MDSHTIRFKYLYATLVGLTLTAVAVWRFLPATTDPMSVIVDEPGELPQEQSSQAQQLGTSMQPGRVPQDIQLAPRQSREQVIDSLLMPLFGEHEQLQLAVSGEVLTDFNDFVLTFPEDRQAEIQEQLILAYSEIRLAGIAIERGEFTEAEISAIENPNHVLDRMSVLLSGQELDQLEEALRDRARSTFDQANLSQIELFAADLDPQHQSDLLDTLFNETYALTNPDGIGQAASLTYRTEQQLRAISRTRESLRTSMSTEQFALVEKYLSEQERGIATASLIFN